MIDKTDYTAPVGIPSLAQDEDPVEIEIVDPEEVTIGVDGVEIVIEPGKENTKEDFNANLAEEMEDGELSTLASDLISSIDNDLNARKDWEETYKDGIKLLGLQYEERSEPWEGACGVFHPMITEAVVRFQSETIMETFPAAGPVKTNIVGAPTREKEDAAKRVTTDLNYQLVDVMVEFRPEHERMLWNLPSAGSAFKKVYYDTAMERQTSRFVPAEDVILPYGVSDTSTAERLTHRMRKTENELKRLMHTEFYIDEDLGEPSKTVNDLQKAKDEETGFSAINDDRYELYEVHALLELPGFEKDGDGLACPYVVTILKDTNKVLSIRRNWYEDDKTRAKRDHFVHYQYIPGYGSYGFGLFHLIGGFAKSATSIMRQLVDAGTLANLPGGLKTRGLRVKGDDTPIGPGEFRDADVPSGTLRDNILPLPYKEPSSTLYNLLNTIVEEGRRFAATADLKIADMSANTPVGTTLAILERMLKVMSAVQARVHYAFKQELRLLAGIIRDYAPAEYDFEVEDNQQKARKSDFSHVDIIPVSDPNAATMSQRVVQYQAVMQMAQQAPQIYDLPQLHRQMLAVLGIKDAEKLVPVEDDFKPRDPVSENSNIIKLKPVKAFLYQDHQAHIGAHMAFIQDPAIAALIGQNPQAQAVQAALMAHVSEHLGFAYRQRIEKALGIALPAPDAELPEELELEMSRMVADVAPRLVQESQAQAAQQQAQQQAQDPIIQMQQQELQIKQADVQRKQQKDVADNQIAQQELALKQAELMGKQQSDLKKLAHQSAESNKKGQLDLFKEAVRVQNKGGRNGPND
jgi:hypothetical protein